MQNILISNFGTSNDFLGLAQLSSSLKTQYPQANIEVICDAKYRTYSSILNNVHTFRFVEIEKIQQVFSNPLYSDAFAVNYYADIQNDMANTNWDLVINHTNDEISAVLLSTFEDVKRYGTYINQSGLPKMTSSWAIYQNFVAARQNRMSIDKVTLRNHVAHTPYSDAAIKIRQNEEYTLMASQNFNRIRQMNGSSDTKIIGINLEAGYDQYLYSKEMLIQLVETLEECSDYKPVLLLNGEQYQKDLVNQLNEKFNNSLISINMDTEALPSVLANIDLMVTTSNDQMSVADMMDVRLVVIREEAEKFTTQVQGQGNYFIQVKDEVNLGNDIILIINEEFGTAMPVESMNSANPVYKIIADQYSTFFSQIRGDINIKNELNYHLERSFFFELFGYERNSQLLTHIRDNTDFETLIDYTNEIKAELTSTVKILLATIRSLKNIKQSQDGLNQFIQYLDTLIMAGASSSCVGNILKYFEGEIENIDSDNADDNISKIEAKLFELKSNLQLFTNYLSFIVEKPTQTSVQGQNLTT